MLASNDHTGEIFEAGWIGGDQRAVRGRCGGGDDQVVCSARPARTPRVGEQNCVRPGHVQVVRLNRDLCKNAFDVGAATFAAPLVGEFDADEQLGCGDGGKSNIVLILD